MVCKNEKEHKKECHCLWLYMKSLAGSPALGGLWSFGPSNRLSVAPRLFWEGCSSLSFLPQKSMCEPTKIRKHEGKLCDGKAGHGIE